jgi:hypothetical protein
MNLSASLFKASTAEEWRTAYFVAGQAMIALLEHLPIACASTNAHDNVSAWIDVDEPILPLSGPLQGVDREWACRIVRALLAGPAAQAAYSFGNHPVPFDFRHEEESHASTVWHAVSLAGRIDGNRPPLIPRLWREVQDALFRPEIWAAVTTVAEALIREGELAGCEIVEIAKNAISCSR